MTSGQHFGNLLRAWRTENQFTQRQVAEMLAPHFDKPKIASLERGSRKSLTVEEALLLCSLMDAELRDALDPIPVPKPRRLAPDWLGRRVAEEMGLPYAEVLRRTVDLYGRDASAEHAARCGRVKGHGGRSFAIARGNITRGIATELAGAIQRAS